MIDREQFILNFKPFDKEVVLEIIDIFIEEYPERMAELKKNILEEDFDALRFNAHSLKGVIANFIAPGAKSLARDLEEHGANQISDNNMQLYEDLKTATDMMIVELKELRKTYL